MQYEEEILLNVRKIMRAIDMNSSRLAKDFGLTTPQLLCLKKLAQSGDMKPSDLSKAVNLSHATITGIINRLEKKHLIKKTRSQKDGRSFVISIVKEGLSMVSSAPSVLQDRFMNELSKLEEWEKTQILSSLQRVAHILIADSIEAAPVLTTGPVEASAELITELLDGHETQYNNK
jgi:DNA-binding MarR family transcriptional regulator